MVAGGLLGVVVEVVVVGMIGVLRRVGGAGKDVLGALGEGEEQGCDIESLKNLGA